MGVLVACTYMYVTSVMPIAEGVQWGTTTTATTANDPFIFELNSNAYSLLSTPVRTTKYYPLPHYLMGPGHIHGHAPAGLAVVVEQGDWRR